MITKTKRLVLIEAYQDEDGKPVCGECKNLCAVLSGKYPTVGVWDDEYAVLHPGPTCPVWGEGSIALPPQEPLGEEFEKVLHDNLWELYEGSKEVSE